MGAPILAGAAVGGVHRPTCRTAATVPAGVLGRTGYTIQVHREARQRHRTGTAAAASATNAVYAGLQVRHRLAGWSRVLRPAYGAGTGRGRDTRKTVAAAQTTVNPGRDRRRRRRRRPCRGSRQLGRGDRRVCWAPWRSPPGGSPDLEASDATSWTSATPRRRWRCRSSSPACRWPATAGDRGQERQHRSVNTAHRGARQDGRAHLGGPRVGGVHRPTCRTAATVPAGVLGRFDRLHDPTHREARQRRHNATASAAAASATSKAGGTLASKSGPPRCCDQHTAPATGRGRDTVGTSPRPRRCALGR